MTIEVRPMGVTCNISCTYCYQNPIRDAGNFRKPYDMEAMKKSLEAEGGPFSLFGGEPLLTPIEDLEELWRWGLERHRKSKHRRGRKSNGIQTNGSLITDAHIELFKKYDVSVGISIDGPGELNDARWSGSLEKTREMTKKTEDNIKKLIDNGVTPGLIVTLHKINASKERLPRLLEWFLELEKMGIRSSRLHILEIDNYSVGENIALSVEENIEVFKRFVDFEFRELTTLRFDKFGEMIRLLRGDDKRVTCVWKNCDPWTTSAVRGVEGNGERSNCGRTNKEGVDWFKADSEGWERYISLYNTPQEYGGCKGCKFFLMCRGQCPGTSIDGDWRNKSMYCGVWKSLFQLFEDRLIDVGEKPLSLSPDREAIEAEMVKSWIGGEKMSLSKAKYLVDREKRRARVKEEAQ